MAPDGIYFWQIIRRRQAEQFPSTVWQFQVGPNARFANFSWAPITSTQYLDRPFPIQISAEDNFRHTVTNFTGSVMLTALLDRARPASVLISEVDPGPKGGVEFINLSTAPVDVSGWEVTLYDTSAWPEPRQRFIFPRCPLAPVAFRFSLKRPGTTLIGGLNFVLEKDVDWGRTPTNASAAVLLRDQTGLIVDFVCLGSAFPGQISRPVSVSSGEWYGSPVPVTTNTLWPLTYQRVGSADHQNAHDWIIGQRGDWVIAGRAPRFEPGTAAVAVTPNELRGFVNGKWSGQIQVHTPADSVRFMAEDRREHVGLSNPVRIEAKLPLFFEIPAFAFEGDGVLTNGGSLRLLEAASTNLVVALSSSDATEVQVPTFLPIPAGQTNATFDISIADDALLDGTQAIFISGSAFGYGGQSQVLQVHDNESAILTITVPAEVSEASGIAAGMVMIDRMAGKDVNVNLKSSDPQAVVAPLVVTVPAGRTNATFNLTIVNNDRIDGDRSVVIDASVLNWRTARTRITIKDEEHRRLLLTLPSPDIGNTTPSLRWGQVSISGKLQSSLTVNLFVAPANEVVLTNTVTIPAGQISASFEFVPVAVPDFRILPTVTVTASAEGFESARLATEIPNYFLRNLDLSVGDLIYHAAMGRILASIPSGTLSNHVAIIDPVADTIERTIRVGAGPTVLALTDDGNFLYVGLRTDLAVQRIDLKTFTPEPPFSLDGHWAGDLEAIPGRPDAVAVNRWIVPLRQGATPVDLSIYAKGVRLSNTVSEVGALARSTKANTLFALGGRPPEQVGGAIREIRVEDSGPVIVRTASVPLERAYWTSAGHLLFSGTGRVFDSDAFEELPPIPDCEGLFAAPDIDRQRVFYFGYPGSGNAALTEGDLGTRTIGRSVSFKSQYPAGSLIRWGNDGLAFSTGNQLQILRTSFVPNGPPVDLSVRISAAPLPAMVGRELKLSLTVSNSGPATASSVELRNILSGFLPLAPTGVEWISASGTQGQYTTAQTSTFQSMIHGDLGILTNGGSASVTVSVKPLHAGIWTNEVVLRCAQMDANPEDNRVPLVFRVLIPDQPDSRFDIGLGTSDLIYEPHSDRLFGSVPSGKGQFTNSLVRINPSTADIEADFLIGLDPGKLARSADGQFLYVALDGEAAIRRFDLESQTPGPKFSIGTNAVPRQFTVSDIKVSPIDPEILFVAVRNSSVVAADATTVTVFDHGKPRPFTVTSGLRIDITPDGGALFGLWLPPGDGRTSILRKMSVWPEGLRMMAETTNMLEQTEFGLAGNLVFTASEEIVDPIQLKRVGLFPHVSAYKVLPELDTGRVLFLSRSLSAYDFESQREIGGVSIPVWANPNSLVRCGADRVAIGTPGGIVILRTSLLPTGPETNLRLEMTATPNPVESGRAFELEFRIRAENVGPNAAERLSLELRLPNALWLPSVDSSQFKMSEAFGLVAGTLPRLEPGQAAEAKVRARTSPDAGLFPMGGLLVAHARLFSAAAETNFADNFVDLPIRMTWTTRRNELTRLVLPNADLAYDRTRLRFYASVPLSGTEIGMGDSIAIIDPVTASVERMVPVGTEPDLLAISSDAQFLYLVLKEEKALRRFDLSTLTLDKEFTIPIGDKVSSLRASPRDPSRVAWVQDTNAFVSRGTNAVKLDLSLPDYPLPREARSIIFSETGDRLYVIGRGRIGREGATVFLMNKEPPAQIATIDTLNSDYDYPMIAAGGRFYSRVGGVFLPDTLTLEHTFPVGTDAAVAVEPEVNRAYFLRPGVFIAFDLSSKNQVYSNGVSRVAVQEGLFIRWGADGFATRIPNEIHIFRSDSVPLVPLKDSDQDSIPDTWELAWDLNPNLPLDALTDLDGDGASNRDEYRAGTNPRDQGSVFRIASVELRDGRVFLRFSAVAGLSYRLQSADILPPGAWQDVGADIVGGETPIEVSVPISDRAPRFLRIRAMPQSQNPTR